MKCKDCVSYTPSQSTEPGRYDQYSGACSIFDALEGENPEIDQACPWSEYGYDSGVHVGPEFGCVHFEAKEKMCINDAISESMDITDIATLRLVHDMIFLEMHREIEKLKFQIANAK